MQIVHGPYCELRRLRLRPGENVRKIARACTIASVLVAAACGAALSGLTKPRCARTVSLGRSSCLNRICVSRFISTSPEHHGCFVFPSFCCRPARPTCQILAGLIRGGCRCHAVGLLQEGGLARADTCRQAADRGRGKIEAAQEFTGDVRARVESRLGFRVGGKIIKREVELGQRVKVGQVLARLDARTISSAPMQRVHRSLRPPPSAIWRRPMRSAFALCEPRISSALPRWSATRPI